MHGTITNLIKKTDGRKDKGGYGFIRDESGSDRFFHARDLETVTGISAPGLFEVLLPGSPVTFEPTTRPGGKGNGLGAEHVRVHAA